MGNNLVDFEAYVKQKKHEEYEQRKSMVYLRAFNFDHLRYNKRVEKNGKIWNVQATRNPNDPRNLYFDVYDEDMQLVKVFVITERENTDVSNLDYHIWNKIDGVHKGNPVIASGEYFEPDENGKVDDRDWSNPWLKCNEGRYEVVKPSEYFPYVAQIERMLRMMNEEIAKARGCFS